MSESQNSQDEPTPESTSDASSGKSSNAAVPIILGCVGCGCLGLIIVPILAAIALPSFLNQANKAREAEAKTYMGSMLRAQQAYHIENAAFSSTIEDLGLGLSTESNQYSYVVELQPDGASVMITATAKEAGIKSYAGAVYAIGNDPATAVTHSQLCESDSATTTAPASPVLTDPTTPMIECAPGSSEVF
ncbi:MAG: type IV pilin-like G/H family protein [Cyanobacteria bacterium P01_A01_bin.123]